MSAYVCMLRGINVSGKNLIKMDELRSCFEDMGFSEVSTYIQSGNVIFKARGLTAVDIVRRISGGIAERFSPDIKVFLRASAELSMIVQKYPFKDSDIKHTAVVFTDCEVSDNELARIESLKLVTDEVVAAGREIFIKVPGGFGRSKLNNSNIERVLKGAVTIRNWNTVLKLKEIAGL